MRILAFAFGELASLGSHRPARRVGYPPPPRAPPPHTGPTLRVGAPSSTRRPSSTPWAPSPNPTSISTSPSPQGSTTDTSPHPVPVPASPRPAPPSGPHQAPLVRSAPSPTPSSRQPCPPPTRTLPCITACRLRWSSYTSPWAFSSSVCGIHPRANESAPTPRGERLFVSRLLTCLRGPVADAMPL
jgi:hypothetical protein